MSLPAGQSIAKLEVVTPPEGAVVSGDEVTNHLNLDNINMVPDWALLVDAATQFAEQSMNCSLLPRTYRINFDDAETDFILPRGPLIAINAVTVGADNTPTTDYKLRHIGRTHRLELGQTAIGKYPVRVTYQAGHQTIPTIFKTAILQHVSTLNENRESIADRQMVDVPQTLREFYRLYARKVGVG